MNPSGLSLCMTAAAALLAITQACDQVSGRPVDGGRYRDGGLVSGVACSSDGDCADGRFCSSAGICEIECRNSGDCYFMMADPSSPNPYSCSRCGRCIESGKADEKCRDGKKDIHCESTKTCTDEYGPKFQCSMDKYCTTSCKTDEDCLSSMGARFACTDMGDGTRICTKPLECTWDNRCIAFGWGYYCDLPVGMDQFRNTYPPEGVSEVVSTCKKKPSGVDWGPHADPGSPSYGYHGVWGMLLNNSVRSTGMPLFAYLNTVDIQYLLMKLSQGPAGTSDLSIKFCSIELVHFLDKDEPFESTKMIIPLRYTEYLPVQTVSSIGAVPPMEAGAFFTTEWLLNVRGALLPDPAGDPLPDFKNCPGGACAAEWDQDKDGKPGMTTRITGVIGAGEIYITKRATMKFNVKVQDMDHILGIVNQTFEQGVIDSVPSTFNYSLKYSNIDPDRSFFKAVRMPDDASCNDVINLGKSDGSFIKFQWRCPECQ